jgi:hypothetical protein
VPSVARDLRPRGVGAILDDAISVYRANWRLILPLIAMVVLPAAMVYSILSSFYLQSVFQTFGALVQSLQAGVAPPPASSTNAFVGTLSTALESLYALTVIYFGATLFATIGQLVQGVRPTVREALRAGAQGFWPLLVVQFLAALLIGASVVVTLPVLGLGGAAVGVFLSMAGPVVVIEGGIGRAFSRSFALVRRHFWRVLVIIGGAWLIATQFEGALSTPLLVREVIFGVQANPFTTQLAWGWKVFDGVVQGAAIALVVPFTHLVTVLTYLDLRSREEGMDLVVRARVLLAGR